MGVKRSFSDLNAIRQRGRGYREEFTRPGSAGPPRTAVRPEGWSQTGGSSRLVAILVCGTTVGRRRRDKLACQCFVSAGTTSETSGAATSAGRASLTGLSTAPPRRIC